MEAKRCLFSWIGNRDFQAACQICPELEVSIRNYRNENEIDVISENRPSPLRLALEQSEYDEVILLMDFRTERLKNGKVGKQMISSYCKSFQNVNIKIVPVVLFNSKDFGEVYQCCNEVLDKYYSYENKSYFLLSAGTSAMTAAWILLGKTVYSGNNDTKFLQLRDDKIQEVEIPFSLYDYTVRQKTILHADLEKYVTEIDGEGEVMAAVKKKVAMIAPHGINVWLSGETGVGKEVFARAIHRLSHRQGRFEAVNCALISKELQSSELFGHKKGAFTGATKDYDGAFKRADNGTLFLDEVAELSLEIQAALLRVLQPDTAHRKEKMTTRTFAPLGGEKEIQCDVRLVLGTNKDLRKMVADGTFRADLYERMAAYTINIPPLRSRGEEDIRMIAEKQLDSINEEFRENAKNQTPPANYRNHNFSPETIKFIMKYSWPRNIRQLRNAIIRGCINAQTDTIQVADLEIKPEDLDYPSMPTAIAGADLTEQPVNLRNMVEHLEIAYIQKAMELFPDSKTKAAEWLGLKTYQALDVKRRKYHL